jgi:hypothetical protein
MASPSAWGVLIPDLWKLISRKYLPLGAMRKLYRLNSNFLELARVVWKEKAYTAEFVHEEQPERKEITLHRYIKKAKILTLFPLFSSPNVVLIAVFLETQIGLEIFKLGSSELFRSLRSRSRGTHIVEGICSIQGDQYLMLRVFLLDLFDEKGQHLRQLQNPSLGPPHGITCDRNAGNTFISCSGDKIVVLDAKLETRAEIRCRTPMAISVRGEELFAVTDHSPHKISVFNSKTFDPLGQFPVTIAQQIEIDSSGVVLACSKGFYPVLPLYDREGKKLREFALDARSIALTAGGELFVLLSSQETKENSIIKISGPSW